MSFFKQKKPTLPTWPFVLMLIVSSGLVLLIVVVQKSNKNTPDALEGVPSAVMEETVSAPTAEVYQQAIYAALSGLAARLETQKPRAELLPLLHTTREAILATTVPADFKSVHLYTVLTLDKTIEAVESDDANQFAELINDLMVLRETMNAAPGSNN